MLFKNLLLGFGGLGVAGVAGYGIYYALTNNKKNAAQSQYGSSNVMSNGQVVTQPSVDKGLTITSGTKTVNNV